MHRPTPPAQCALILCLALSAIAWTPWGAIYGSARDERSVGDQAADKKISLTIKTALADKDSALALKVHVYCFLGQVYLVGAINDTAFRSFSVKTAKGTSGVKKVTQYFVAESDTTTADLELVAKVRTALIGNSDLSSTQIEQEVMNGEVVLIGMVRTKADAALAVKVAKSVKGVRKVTSFLIPSK
ncbi:BON domain-containing protein [Pseudodesulfovibrio thermohalotolerans]|uniref:BON domain-containing protein n=1 Tax=Pseudodesulfovibrio thermohalotolerans TaxID=2880651 RepID=UPI002442D234|nr:BON domain-containing protein [Pseudodesulfovibrio thermohalotolerans]WFS63604.1 BON domain-containing protein [Pseudodesulfovibrio thermohalotolerans]